MLCCDLLFLGHRHRGFEKACISRPGQLLHCIDVTSELPAMCFAEQFIYTTN